MRAQLVEGTEIVGLAWDPAEYRVRIWGNPPKQGFARALEEWSIRDFGDLAAVQHWAEREANGRDLEVFAMVVRPEDILYVRVWGNDGDSDTGASQNITFSD